MVEVDITLPLDEYNSSFITYEIEPGIYTFKDNSEALLRILQPEYEGYHNAIDIDYDDITMKTKLVVRAGFLATKVDEHSFFTTVLSLLFQSTLGLETL